MPMSLKDPKFKISDAQSSNPFGFVYWNLSGLVLTNFRFGWFNDPNNNVWRNLTDADQERILYTTN